MNTLNLSILTSAEVFTSAQRIDAIISAKVSHDPFITKVRPVIVNNIANLSVALGRTTDSTYAKLLEEKDLARDSRYIALRDYCKAMLTDEDKNIADAAVLLINLFKELGWSMHLEGYSTQSSKLQALIGRCEKAPISTAITTIKAGAKLAGLKDATAAFEAVSNNKVDAKTREEYPKIADCRKGLNRYLSALLSYVEIMTELDGGEFKDAMSQITLVVKEFETIAHSRLTKKKNDKATTDPKITQ